MDGYTLLREDLLNCCKNTLNEYWGKKTFDEWLFMDAGTSFGYAFEANIKSKLPNFIFQDKKGPFDYGKLCIYKIQCLIRNNQGCSIEMIIEFLETYISDLIVEMKSKKIELNDTSCEYGYFN